MLSFPKYSFFEHGNSSSDLIDLCIIVLPFVLGCHCIAMLLVEQKMQANEKGLLQIAGLLHYFATFRKVAKGFLG